MNEEAEPNFEKKMIRVKSLKPEIIIIESFSGQKNLNLNRICNCGKIVIIKHLEYR